MNKKKHDLKKTWLLHQDNTEPHAASILKEFLEKGKIEVLIHCMYNPDLTACNFWIFVALKWELSSRHFEWVKCQIGECHKLFHSRPSSKRISQNDDCKMEKENAGVYCDWWWLLWKRYCGVQWWGKKFFFLTFKTHFFTFARGWQMLFFF